MLYKLSVAFLIRLSICYCLYVYTNLSVCIHAVYSLYFSNISICLSLCIAFVFMSMYGRMT